MPVVVVKGSFVQCLPSVCVRVCVLTGEGTVKGAWEGAVM